MDGRLAQTCADLRRLAQTCAEMSMDGRTEAKSFLVAESTWAPMDSSALSLVSLKLVNIFQ